MTINLSTLPIVYVTPGDVCSQHNTGGLYRLQTNGRFGSLVIADPDLPGDPTGMWSRVETVNGVDEALENAWYPTDGRVHLVPTPEPEPIPTPEPEPIPLKRGEKVTVTSGPHRGDHSTLRLPALGDTCTVEYGPDSEGDVRLEGEDGQTLWAHHSCLTRVTAAPAEGPTDAYQRGFTAARVLHEADMAKTGERLIAEACDRSPMWCEEYDRVVASINDDLTVPLPIRHVDRDYSVSGRIELSDGTGVPFYTTVTLNRPFDDAEEDLADEIAEALPDARVLLEKVVEENRYAGIVTDSLTWDRD